MKLYRYEDVNFTYRITIKERKFEVLKETLCGYWIEKWPGARKHKRWVSSTAKKRYAYPTRKEAMINFKARKYRQKQLVEGQLKRVKDAIHYVDIDFPEFKNDFPFRREHAPLLWDGWGEIT